MLLMRRAERANDPWSGHWSFPGGKRDPQDPDLLHTALRELEEECGIRLDSIHLEAALPHMLARRKIAPFLLVAPFLFQVEEELPAMLNAHEAVASMWAPLGMLLDPARHHLRPVPGVPAELRYPAIDLDTVPLWGFTYRLITHWLGMVPWQPAEDASFAVAGLVLDFLLERGLKLEHGWEERAGGKAAAVGGPIPAEAVFRRFCSGPHVAMVNTLEVRREYVRLVGMTFEEYWIHA